MDDKLENTVLDELFRSARTYNAWMGRNLSDDEIRQLYEVFKWGPTSANSCPARFVWVRSEEGKKRLAALTSEKNQPKVLAAPMTVIVGYDLDFPETMPELFPDRGEMMKNNFKSDPGLVETTGFRNSSLQGAYMIVAARALGYDCGPMSGFNNAAVDQAFFAGTRIKSNFICSIGHGSAAGLHPRNPRLTFDEAGHFA